MNVVMKTLNVLGLNSGTSMDGVDAAVFKISPLNGEGNGDFPRLKIQPLASDLILFDPLFQKRLAALVGRGHATLDEMCLLNTALGHVFAQSAQVLINKAKKLGEEVQLIGSHGQTIWHHPAQSEFWGVRTSGTLQLGDAAVLQAICKVPVVSDFRANDVAYGGQGAPLVSFADEVLFGHMGKALGVLNIGGIANLTVINDDGRAVMAYDTGPGNMIMDYLASVFFDKACDEDGKIAASGKVDEDWLESILKHPYFQMAPPKTTGREDFGQKFAEQLLHDAKERGIEPKDAIATATALTATSIARSYLGFVRRKVEIQTVIIGGGGGQNKTLMQFLKKEWGGNVELLPHEHFGISTKFKEALLFALLAYTTYFGIPNNVPECTGASRRVCLGKIIH